MLRRIILALIGLLAVVNGSKWLFDGKRLPTLGLNKNVVKSPRLNLAECFTQSFQRFLHYMMFKRNQKQTLECHAIGN